ncbi:hypothetical protein ACQ4PT_005497 [Festuca glaucescens]
MDACLPSQGTSFPATLSSRYLTLKGKKHARSHTPATRDPDAGIRRRRPLPCPTHQPKHLVSSAASESPLCPPGFESPRFTRGPTVDLLIPSDLDSVCRAPLSSGSEAVPDSLDRGASSAPDEPGAAARKVRFAAQDLQLDLVIPGIHGAPRPCLKKLRASSAPTINAWAPDTPVLRAAEIVLPGPPSLLACSLAVSPQGQLQPRIEEDSQGGWTEVKPPYWWRANARTNRGSQQWQRLPPYYSSSRKTGFVKHHRRFCHRCLSKGHCRADCRDPLRCRACRRNGHKARDCTNSSSSLSSYAQSSSTSPRPSSASSPPVSPSATASSSPPSSTSRSPSPFGSERGPAATMPRIGDPSLRTAEGHVLVMASAASGLVASQLTNQAAVVWLGRGRPKVNAAEMSQAIHDYTGVDQKLYRVVPHFPEDFFVSFDHQHHRELLTKQPGRFSHGELDIHACPWRLNAHTDVIDFYHHVHLCIEGVELNDWTDDIAAQILGPKTVFHYFDIATLMKEDATALKLWAWSADPNKIPKVQYVTVVPKPDVGNGGASSTVGRRGLVRRAIIHLDLHEDYTPDRDGRPPRQVITNTFDWILGVIDGEQQVRDRAKTPSRSFRDDDRDRRDEDRDRRRDDDDRGRRRDTSRQSWSDRLFRSRSRAATRRMEDRDRGGYRRDDSHRGDRDGRDGRRRGMELDTPDARRIDRARTQRLKDGSVLPASGSRARNRSPDRVAIRHRTAARCTERGRSLPPAPRPNSSIIVETHRSSPLAWLRCASPCCAAQVRPQADGEAVILTSLPAAASVSASTFATPVHAAVGLSPTSATATSEQRARSSSPVIQDASPRSATPIHDPGARLLLLSAEDEDAGHSPLSQATPLFVPMVPALLDAPASTPPRPPTARRKTLAGVSGFVGFPVSRSSPRLKKKRGGMPIARLAEKVLCHRLGIVNEGEEVTEAAIAKFVQMFKGTLPDIAISALRALFRMDCDFASAVEQALVDHGGQGGADLQPQVEADGEA